MSCTVQRGGVVRARRDGEAGKHNADGLGCSTKTIRVVVSRDGWAGWESAGARCWRAVEDQQGHFRGNLKPHMAHGVSLQA